MFFPVYCLHTIRHRLHAQPIIRRRLAGWTHLFFSSTLPLLLTSISPFHLSASYFHHAFHHHHIQPISSAHARKHHRHSHSHTHTASYNCTHMRAYNYCNIYCTPSVMLKMIYMPPHRSLLSFHIPLSTRARPPFQTLYLKKTWSYSSSYFILLFCDPPPCVSF